MPATRVRPGRMLADSAEAGRRPTFTEAGAADAAGAAASGADTTGAAVAAEAACAAGVEATFAAGAAGAAAPAAAGADGAATACAGAKLLTAAGAAGVAGVAAVGVAAAGSLEVAAGADTPSAEERPATVTETVARPGVPETALPVDVNWVATSVWVPAAVPAGIVAVPFSTEVGANEAMTRPSRASRWISMFVEVALLL